MKEAQDQRNKVWRHLRAILKDHKGQRLKDLQNKIHESLGQNNLQAAKEYTQLIEKEKDTWRGIKSAPDRSLRDPLSTITIPGNTVTTDTGATLTNPTTVLTAKQEAEEAIVEKNIQRFSAAEQTPIGLNTVLYKAIGPHRTSKLCDTVLNAQLTDADRDNI